jgi:biopolymer transport protein TolQ
VDRIAIKLETFIEEFSNILQRSLGANAATGSGSASGH